MQVEALDARLAEAERLDLQPSPATGRLQSSDVMRKVMLFPHTRFPRRLPACEPLPFV